MIDVRNKKNKLIPFYSPHNPNKTEEDSEKNTNNDKNNQIISSTNIQNLSWIIILLLILSLLWSILFFRKQKKIMEMNIQVNAHSIDKINKIETFTKDDINIQEKFEIIEKKNEIRETFKSNIVIDKENVLGHGANGTIVYNGLFQNREMAIKRIISHNSELAKQEMDILMKLDHANIIKFYYYEEQKSVFIIL